MRLATRFATPLALACLACPILAPAQPPRPTAAAPAQRASFDPSLFAALRYRLIGPLRGGRVTTVTGV
ncbi:MAG: hypothetical protein ACHQQ3_14045, partial [Gemmatimonadales bacterium]